MLSCLLQNNFFFPFINYNASFPANLVYQVQKDIIILQDFEIVHVVRELIMIAFLPGCS